MRRQVLDPLPERTHPPEEWRLVERAICPDLIARMETLFTVSNGYIGIRGSFSEGAPFARPHTFINGFHETWPINYGEAAFGFAKTGQTILGAPDPTPIRLYIDDEPLDLQSSRLLQYERALDFRSGLLEQMIIWETLAGRVVRVRSSRLASLTQRHVAAISYQAELLNGPAPLTITSGLIYHGELETDAQLDPRQTRSFARRVLESAGRRAISGRVLLSYRTRSSGMAIACGIDHTVTGNSEVTPEIEARDDFGSVSYSFDARPEHPVTLTKFITYHTSHTDDSDELMRRAERTLSRVVSHGWNTLTTQQRAFLDEFWDRSDVVFAGEPRMQQALRLNLFHVIQASARADGRGVAAKGLTGQGYEGHCFWDSEIYVLAFLTYTFPRLAYNLLQFRVGMLGAARDRARAVNQRGALFPWRTINGEEASASYAAGTAQYHINADIVYAIRKYVNATGDQDFLCYIAAELLVETARLWYDLGFFSEDHTGTFRIHGVTGPDEYNTVVNNNCFTNLMARENLQYAAQTIETLQNKSPDLYGDLVEKTGLTEEELCDWRRAAACMFVPYDEGRGVHLQDDQFVDREPWDFAGTPLDRYPLLLHYHPLVIYRHRVIKQADVVLATFLLSDDFTAEEKRANFDFYDPMTTGDSSLSACVQAIMAAEVGYCEKAMTYARCAFLMDVANVSGNVQDGCHIASMAGSWMAVVYGLAGFRDYGGQFRFNPRRPPCVQRISFKLRLGPNVLGVEMSGDAVTYTLQQGDTISFCHMAETIVLTARKSCVTRGLVEWADDEGCLKTSV